MCGWGERGFGGAARQTLQGKAATQRTSDKHHHRWHAHARHAQPQPACPLFSVPPLSRHQSTPSSSRPQSSHAANVNNATFNASVDSQELILFSRADLERSIPSVVDGLKPGQRKILYCCFKRNLKKDIKVRIAQGIVDTSSRPTTCRPRHRSGAHRRQQRGMWSQMQGGLRHFTGGRTAMQQQQQGGLAAFLLTFQGGWQPPTG